MILKYLTVRHRWYMAIRLLSVHFEWKKVCLNAAAFEGLGADRYPGKRR